MAKIQIKNSFITSSAQITISSSLVRFSDNIRAKGITGSFSGSFAGSNMFVQGGNSFGNTALLGTNDNQPLVLETNGSEKLRITTAGSVGVGTSSPNANLHVSGTFQVGNGTNFGNKFTVYDNLASGKISFALRDTNGDDIFSLYANSTTGEARLIADDDNGVGFMTFQMNANERMRITNGGNVGIGTTSPISLLDVRSGYITTGTGVSTSGTTILAGYYTSGHLTVLGTEQSSGGPVLGYAVTPSTSATGAFLSSTTITIPRSAYVQDGGTHRWYTGASQTVAIGSAVTTSEKMRMDTNGNLGIGTTSPGYKLDVNGTFNASGTSTLAAVSITGTINSSATEAIRINNNNGFISFYNSAGNTRTGYLQGNTGNSLILAAENSTPILFSVGGSEVARIATSGNVGIGTSSPARKLDISGSAIRSFSAGGSGEPGFIVDYPSSNGYGAFFIHVNGNRRWRIGSVGDTNTQPALNFWQEGTGSRMIINNQGNVGIGTTSVTQKLEVAGVSMAGSGAYRTSIYGDNGGAYLYFGTTANTSVLGTIGTYGGLFNINSTNGDTSFQYNGSEKMRITTGGNVGIGTSSPAAFLDIVGVGIQTLLRNTSATSYTSLRLYNNQNSSVRALEIDYSGASYSGALITGGPTGESACVTTTGAYPLAFGTNNTARMTILSGGNVGIATNSPTAKLQVGTQMYGSAPDANYFVVGNENFSGPGPVGGISGYPTTGNRNQVTASMFDIAGGWERVNGSHALLRVSAYDVINSTPALTVLNNGNVGMGTNSPASRLQLGNLSSTQTSVPETLSLGGTYSNSAGANVKLRVYEDGGGNAIGGMSVSAGQMEVNTWSAGKIAFYRGTTQTAIIDANGNLGIGTSSPTAKLDVSGDIKVGSGTTSTTKVTGSLHVTGSITLNTSRDSNWPLLISDPSTIGGSGRYQLGKVGAMGFNYADSYAQLQIIGSSGAYIDLGNSATDDLDARLIYFSNSRLQLEYGTQMAINSTGVGIGTTSPGSPLDVYSSTNGQVSIYVRNPSTGTAAYAGLAIGNNNGSNSGGIVVFGSNWNTAGLYNPNGTYVYSNQGGGLVLASEAAAPIIFGTNNTERMRILSNGNVGIGSSSPTATLDVNGSIHLNGNIRDVWNDNVWNVAQFPNNSTSTPTYNMGFQVETATRIFYISNKNNDGSATDPNGGIIFRTGATPSNRMIISYTGNVGIGTTTPLALLDVRGNTKFGSSLSNTHQFTGSVNFGGSVYNDSVIEDRFEYFSLQPYIEGGSFPTNVFSTSGGNVPTFLTMTGSACPFGKVAYNTTYYEAIGDFIPVNPGETLYGEIWAYRSAGATGTAGVFYTGIARYDKDKRPIDGNAGLTYFIVQNATVPSNSTWTKYSGTTTLPLTHTPFGGSDGGPVRYIRPYIIVNYVSGTIPTYWGAFKIRKQQLTRDFGAVTISGSLGIGTSSPTSILHTAGSGDQVVRFTHNDNVVGRTLTLRLTNNNATYLNSGAYIQAIQGSGIDNYSLAFGTTNNATTSTEKVRISTDGNVGIGTTTPTRKLEVYNSANSVTYVRINNQDTGTSAYTGIDLQSYGGGWQVRVPASTTFVNPLQFSFNDAEKVRIQSDGNVGIGTTNPTGSLHVYKAAGTSETAIITIQEGAGGASELVFRSGNAGANRRGAIRFFSNQVSTTTAQWTIGASMAQSSGDNSFYFYNNTNTSLLTLSQTNVGIGSVAPAYKLDVNGESNFNGIIRVGTVAVLNEVNSANDIYANIRVIRNRSSTLQDGMYINYDSTGTTAAHLRFYANAQNERMRIQANDGFVGIGTTSAAGRLDVYDSTDAGHIAFVRNASAGANAYSAIVLRRDGGNNGIVLFTNSSTRTVDGGAGNSTIRTDNGNLLLGAGGSSQHVLTTAGSVGIGTTSPSARVHIVQNNSGGIPAIRLSEDESTIQGPATNTQIRMGSNLVLNASSTMLFGTNGSEAVRILSNGNVGISTTSPSTKFSIVGTMSSVSINAQRQYTFSSIGSTNDDVWFRSSTSFANNGAAASLNLARLTYQSAGTGNDLTDKVGIWLRGFYDNSGGGLPIYLGGYAYSSQIPAVTITGLNADGLGGNLGIGTTAPLSKLNSYGSGSNLSLFRVDGGNGTLFEVTDQLSGSLFSVNDVSGLPLLEVFSNNRVVAGKYGSNALVVSGSSVGIGTTTPAYKLQVNGSFAATTKSFVIKHPDPAKSDKQLVHGVTEGPEHSVFVRGKLENNNVIQLPDYWQHLVDVDTISVTLTSNKYYQRLYVKNVTDTAIEVGSETDKPINCYYYIVGERKDIPKLITEI